MAYDYLARIQILGQYGVGKAAICERFVYDTFKVSSNYGGDIGTCMCISSYVIIIDV